MKNFDEMLQVVRDLKPGEATAYVAEDVPVKVCINFWLEVDETGKVTHFSPHLNFYAGETERDPVFALLQASWAMNTQQDIIDFLQDFAIQSGIDQQARMWERDEGADV